MDITFSNYLSFLNYCHINKIPNVNNMNIYFNKNLPLFFGNDQKIPITDKKDLFKSHIMTQKHALNHLVTKIKDDNTKLIELKDLHKLLKNDIQKNKKQTEKMTIDTSTITISEIKKNFIMFSSENLSDNDKKIIKNLYQEDIDFIKSLEEKYKYYS